MAFIISTALTALLISPIFMLGSGQKTASKRLRARFNTVNNQ